MKMEEIIEKKRKEKRRGKVNKRKEEETMN